ncbi:hypothetical protein L3i22_031570 [Actinoplanes sp. L3-i22]|nr:hypothetical protein L3i22_031570 [Actinoplanes sp. L3-i22]
MSDQTTVDLVRFRLSDGESVIVEVDDRDAGAVRVGGRHQMREAQQILDENLVRIRDATRTVLATLRSGTQPDEIKLVFGIKFNAEAGAVIARTGVEANIGVEMVWKQGSR